MSESKDSEKYIKYKMLEGEEYRSEEFPLWQNQTPCSYLRMHASYRELRYVFEQELMENPKYIELLKRNQIPEAEFPTAEFPLIEDFEVRLSTSIWENREEDRRKEDKDRKYRVIFWSPSLGKLTGPPYELHDLCQPDFKIPCGDFSIPFFDFGMVWAFLITSKDEFVYILDGNFNEAFGQGQGEGYTTWFKVKKEHYMQQWEEAIDLCRAKCKEWFLSEEWNV